VEWSGSVLRLGHIICLVTEGTRMHWFLKRKYSLQMRNAPIPPNPGALCEEKFHGTGARRVF